jgi:hypothetical protein
MAKTLKQHEIVGAEWIADPSKVQVVRHRFPFPAAMVWASLLDPIAWTVWLPITKVTWTSPQPFGVGTTRTVDIGEDSIEEVFFAWEEGRQMAFRFDRSTLPVRAFVEDYRITDTADGCELTWRFRIDAFFLLRPLFNAKMRSGGKSGLPKLEAHIAANADRYRATV